jgi:hypothetical protein
VVVSLPPDMPDGHFSEWVEFSAQAGDSIEPPRTVRLNVVGNVFGRVTLHGQKIDRHRVLHLGSVQAGIKVRENVILRVHDEQPLLDIRKIEAEPQFLRVRVAPLENGLGNSGLYRIELEVPPDAPPADYLGDRAGTVRVRTGHPRLPMIEMKVELAVLSATPQFTKR